MTKTLWVSANASSGNDGSSSTPFSSFKEALKVAEPGTTIMVMPGIYEENVFVRKSGTPDNPIVIKSADGPDSTIIKPASSKYDTFDVGGADHITIDGFTIHVPESEKNGIVVYAKGKGEDFNTASYVTISNNLIVGGNGDGIKGSKAEYLLIDNNVITGHTGTEEAIDFVGVKHAVLTRNKILDNANQAVVFKGGSEDIYFVDNIVDGTRKSGIEIGGYTELPYYWPGFLESGQSFEAKDVLVSGNIITNTGGTGVRIIGGQNIDVVANEISENDNYVVSIDDSSKYHDSTWVSGNILFEGNSVDRSNWFKNRSSGDDIEEIGNYSDGRDLNVGPGDDASIGPAHEIYYQWVQQVSPQEERADTDGSSENDVDKTAPVDEDATPADENATPTDESSAPVDETPTKDEASFDSEPSQPAMTGEELVGTNGRDKMKGSDGNDYLMGHAGNDELTARDGDDVLDGGAGDDRLKGEEGDDVLLAGAGDDRLNGGEGDDFLFSDEGDDRLKGEKGQDILLGGFGDDELDGGDGNDFLSGGGGDDQLKGGDGDDTLFGGEGSDELEGGDGDDVLAGGLGEDFLKGGKGADNFVFDNVDAVDTVEDFNLLEDHLKIEIDGVRSLDDLTIVTDKNGDTQILVVKSGVEHLTIVLEDVDSSDLTADHFIF